MRRKHECLRRKQQDKIVLVIVALASELSQQFLHNELNGSSILSTRRETEACFYKLQPYEVDR